MLATINIRFSVGVIGSSGVRSSVFKEHARKKKRSDWAIKFGPLISPLASNTRDDNWVDIKRVKKILYKGLINFFYSPNGPRSRLHSQWVLFSVAFPMGRLGIDLCPSFTFSSAPSLWLAPLLKLLELHNLLE